MELDFFRIMATIINFVLLIGIIFLIVKFIKGFFANNKRLDRIEKDLECVKNELKNKQGKTSE